MLDHTGIITEITMYVANCAMYVVTLMIFIHNTYQKITTW